LPSVLVDYAHTDDALRNVLQTVRPLTQGRLICVFGCGGDRDKTKRPRMARAAWEFSDVCWLTSDNPRSEDPQAIIDDALAGLDKDQQQSVNVNTDRAQAIRQAILAVEPSDTVLVVGKGHEDYQIIGDQRLPFDDREHAAAALEAWLNQSNTPCPPPT